MTVAEYVSEMAKIGRRTFTDSFSPYLFTNLLTLPTSAVHPNPVDYPTTFSAPTFRHLVREAMLPTLVNVAVQALAIAAIVWLCSSLWHRRTAAASGTSLSRRRSLTGTRLQLAQHREKQGPLSGNRHEQP